MHISVENIKCSGCTSTITKKLSAEFPTANISIDVNQGLVSIDVDKSHTTQVKQILTHLGYPEVGNNSLTRKAKSFASCAIGKFTSEN